MDSGGVKGFMYRKDSASWIKHLDFIVFDLICLQIAYILSSFIYTGSLNPYASAAYTNIAFVIELIDLIVILLFESYKNVIKRGRYVEFTCLVKQTCVQAALLFSYLFVIKQGDSYSRITLFLTYVLYFILDYAVRLFWKKHLQNKKIDISKAKSLFVITNYDQAEEVIRRIQNKKYSNYYISGLAIIDQYCIGKVIADVKVVADAKTVAMYVGQAWIDEVLIVSKKDKALPGDLLAQLLETGVTLHMNLFTFTSMQGRRQIVEKVGDYPVLTISLNYASALQLFIKRCIDLLAGVVGCLITCILFIFIAPCIYIASPGPIFFAQERVGMNGKHFKMYKFRSMYLDAEERKAELMKQNKIQDGRMFKMDFDPRIIGNKILPDGTHKTGIGQFIRKTSLDEFPQFFNVLKGDMSLVGTRPPTVDETKLYELHHYARLAVKPGITGLWQVSGRSQITDFEEVVRLDKEYINTWNIGTDIKIVLKTIKVLFSKSSGAM